MATAATKKPVADRTAAHGRNDFVLTERSPSIYDAGAAPYFDVLAIHAYGWHFGPDEPAAPDAVNFRRAELQRAIMVANGDGGKTAMIVRAPLSTATWPLWSASERAAS